MSEGRVLSACHMLSSLNRTELGRHSYQWEWGRLFWHMVAVWPASPTSTYGAYWTMASNRGLKQRVSCGAHTKFSFLLWNLPAFGFLTLCEILLPFLANQLSDFFGLSSYSGSVGTMNLLLKKTTCLRGYDD